jgi:hypothetical protein
MLPECHATGKPASRQAFLSSRPDGGLSVTTRQAKMADIVYHLPALPIQPAHAISNDKADGYF